MADRGGRRTLAAIGYSLRHFFWPTEDAADLLQCEPRYAGYSSPLGSLHIPNIVPDQSCHPRLGPNLRPTEVWVAPPPTQALAPPRIPVQGDRLFGRSAECNNREIRAGWGQHSDDGENHEW